MEVRKRSKYAVACVNDDDLYVPSFGGGIEGKDAGNYLYQNRD